jgi:hypothetical protein
MIIKLAQRKPWKRLSDLASEIGLEKMKNGEGIAPWPKKPETSSIIKHFKNKKVLVGAAGLAALGGGALAYLKSKKK